MIIWFMLSTVFLMLFLLLRKISEKWMKPQVVYFLWIFAAFRLLIPITIPVLPNSFTFSDLLTDGINDISVFSQNQSENKANNPDLDFTEKNSDQDSGYFTQNGQFDESQAAFNHTANASNFVDSTTLSDENQTQEIHDRKISVWFTVWFAGVLFFLILFSAINMKWYLRIRRSRVLCRHIHSPVPVYVVRWISSPCLAGIFRPAIYVNEGFFERKENDLILEHEKTHYRHRDHIWSLVRILCVCVHWFNPLVWYAAYLSKHDCECACDASVISKLNQQERVIYGNLLLQIVCENNIGKDHFLMSTSISNNAKLLKKRLVKILNRPEHHMVLTVLLILMTTALLGSFSLGKTDAVSDIGFSSKNSENHLEKESEPAERNNNKYQLLKADRNDSSMEWTVSYSPNMNWAAILADMMDGEAGSDPVESDFQKIKELLLKVGYTELGGPEIQFQINGTACRLNIEYTEDDPIVIDMRLFSKFTELQGLQINYALDTPETDSYLTHFESIKSLTHLEKLYVFFYFRQWENETLFEYYDWDSEGDERVEPMKQFRDIRCFSISDLSVFSEMDHLTGLSLENADLPEDISPLWNMPELESLSLKYCGLTETSFVSLKTAARIPPDMNLDGNDITDSSDIIEKYNGHEDGTGIARLSIRYNPITEIGNRISEE